MRIAVLIIGLVLGLALFMQSCAVAVGGSIAEDLSTSAREKAENEDLAGGGGIGVLAALLWLIAAAFVLAKPKVATIMFGIAALLCAIGGSTGFSDLFIWAIVSLILAVLSWRGIIEKEKKDAEDRARYQADIQAAVAAQQAGPPAP